MDDIEAERGRLSRAARTPIVNEAGSRGMVKFIGQVVGAPAEIAPGKYLKVARTRILGAETIGMAATLTPTTGMALAYLIGPDAPNNGDFVITQWEGNRWVVECHKNGISPGSGGIGTTPFCFCTAVPTTLTMTSASETCNFRMFQSCTLTYQPVPDVFASLGLTGSIFTSYPAGFPDPAADNSKFYYYITCKYNQFSLTRLYITSPMGSPFRDAVLYSWLIGGDANTCSPFALIDGTVFPGNDPGCSVTLTA